MTTSSSVPQKAPTEREAMRAESETTTGVKLLDHTGNLSLYDDEMTGTSFHRCSVRRTMRPLPGNRCDKASERPFVSDSGDIGDLHLTSETNNQLIAVVGLTSCNLCAADNGLVFIKGKQAELLVQVVTDDDLLMKALCCLCMSVIKDRMSKWISDVG